MSVWAIRRRMIYLGAVVAFFAVIIWAVYFFFFRVPPSCSDGIKNQDELDVDCGGNICKAVCDSEVSPLIKTWTRLFKTVDGKYDVATLIENPNFSLGLKVLNYTFKLYDADNLFVAEKSGTAFVNARDKFVIFDSGLDTGKRIPTKAIVEFAKPLVWSRVDPKDNKMPLDIQNRHLAEGNIPRLSATVINNSISDLRYILITAVVYDEDNNAIGVSQTFVNLLKKGERSEISFTWPKPFGVSRPTIEIYPRVDMVNGPK